MARARSCNHNVLQTRCPVCAALKKKWYAKLKDTGFHDIEYGYEQPKFIVHSPDPTSPGAEQAQEYYERVWRVFHLWTDSGRSRRDCRIAELLASQEDGTGTVRGISRQLKVENLAPWSTALVQATLQEIYFAVLFIPE